MSETKNKYYEKEQQAIKEMDEETKKAFYEFKENFLKNFEKKLKKDISESDIEKTTQAIDFIELFEALLKNEEAKELLKILYNNCMIYEDVHSLAYELNSEYQILWDNLDEDAKKNVIKGRKMNNFATSIRKVQWGFATFGLTALGAKVLKKRQNNKIEEYVTSEGFTNICILINKYNNYYKKESESENES